jgi:hypothetical protein
VNVTLPFCFLTVTTKLADPLPDTAFEAGETWN